MVPTLPPARLASRHRWRAAAVLAAASLSGYPVAAGDAGGAGEGAACGGDADADASVCRTTEGLQRLSCTRGSGAACGVAGGAAAGVAAACGGAGGPALGSLDCLGARVDNSWTAELSPDPEQQKHVPNKKAREVYSGHFVHVLPTPLPKPFLVAYSREVASLLGVTDEECLSHRFARLFSGDTTAGGAFNQSWATPYALSIYGEEQVPNGAGQSGYGYGDGRAISLAEVVVGSHDGGAKRWELQLKGSGKTPFCRGADGRAVLRSSVREFLVSEAMHHLGVPTSRALSLVASRSEHVQRPWYSEATRRRSQRHGGDVMQREQCAMVTRVAPSFLRVGHFELFGRRARKGDAVAIRQLEELARHALVREYPEQYQPNATLQEQVLAMAEAASWRLARLAAEWVRVGFVQSNFNSDNCLISGLTVDYGPFGFIEEYDPGWGMWIGSGQHFSFMNQPRAAGKNFMMFAQSMLPLLDGVGQQRMREIIYKFDFRAREALQAVLSRKMGLNASSTSGAAGKLWSGLERLLKAHPTDYTIFWRQLAELPGRGGDAKAGEGMLEPLGAAFHGELPAKLRPQWLAWLQQWLQQLAAEGQSSSDVVAAMRRASPRYIPRETMLVEAYKAAQQGDFAPLFTLQELFRHPYDEADASLDDRFYKRRPPDAAEQGGVGFMS